MLNNAASERPKRDSATSTLRLILWPKGRLLLNSNFCAVPLNEGHPHPTKEEDEWDSITLALRLQYYHFFNHRSRIISHQEWARVAQQKMCFSEEFASGVFSAAQSLLPLENVEKWNNLEKHPANNLVQSEPKADLLGLVVIIALLGCRHRSNGSIVEYLRKNLGGETNNNH
jgi:hypothetical protein